jgi:hypothetical protein
LFIYKAVSNISCKTDGDNYLNKHITLSENCTANQGILVANTGQFLRALAMGNFSPNSETLGECIDQQPSSYVETEIFNLWWAYTVDGSGKTFFKSRLVPLSVIEATRLRPKGYFCRVMKSG